MLPLLRHKFTSQAPACRFVNLTTPRSRLLSCPKQAPLNPAHRSLTSSTSTKPPKDSLALNAFPRPKLVHLQKQHARCYSSASASSGTGRSDAYSKAGRITSIGVAGLGTLLLVDWYLSQGPLQTESDLAQSAKSQEQQQDDRGFAPPVPEDDEDLDRRNIVVRGVIKIGNVIHALIIEPFGTARRFL